MNQKYKAVLYLVVMAIIFVGSFLGSLYLQKPSKQNIWTPENFQITNDYELSNNGERVYIPDPSIEIEKMSGWENSLEEFERNFKKENISVTIFLDGFVAYEAAADGKKYITKKDFTKKDVLDVGYITADKSIVLHEERNLGSYVMPFIGTLGLMYFVSVSLSLAGKFIFHKET